MLSVSFTDAVRSVLNLSVGGVIISAGQRGIIPGEDLSVVTMLSTLECSIVKT